MPDPRPNAVEVHPSRCPVCKSTRRTRYHYSPAICWTPAVRTHPATGLPYNCIVTRPTRCLDCGTPRRDRELHYSPHK